MRKEASPQSDNKRTSTPSLMACSLPARMLNPKQPVSRQPLYNLAKIFLDEDA
ncbi:hypothetical protein ES332_D09G143100v1 [Gossypium tomentosum]|uniref:Uncharacterized protein n=1 Tax=Gossypium tomentosum TaxID=34277 RepID=A0A5D2JGR9_GOSTO|nr:hypothetical protein ES332_D09G143100v1 [Gossypium tomentosum]